MMQRNAYIAVSALVFSLVALLHISRLWEAWPVQIGPTSIPVWISWLGLGISAFFAFWGFTALRR